MAETLFEDGCHFTSEELCQFITTRQKYLNALSAAKPSFTLFTPFPSLIRRKTMVARFQSLIALFATIVSVSACGGDHPPSHHKRAVSFEKRQATATYPSGPAYDVPPLASISPTPPTYTDNELPVIATYAPGSQPPLSGAPPLPACK